MEESTISTIKFRVYTSHNNANKFVDYEFKFYTHNKDALIECCKNYKYITRFNELVINNKYKHLDLKIRDFIIYELTNPDTTSHNYILDELHPTAVDNEDKICAWIGGLGSAILSCIMFVTIISAIIDDQNKFTALCIFNKCEYKIDHEIFTVDSSGQKVSNNPKFYNFEMTSVSGIAVFNTAIRNITFDADYIWNMYKNCYANSVSQCITNFSIPCEGTRNFTTSELWYEGYYNLPIIVRILGLLTTILLMIASIGSFGFAFDCEYIVYRKVFKDIDITYIDTKPNKHECVFPLKVYNFITRSWRRKNNHEYEIIHEL